MPVCDRILNRKDLRSYGRFRRQNRYSKGFSDIYVQICQFHQLQIVRRKLTLRPETEAGQELLAITFSIAHTTEIIMQNNSTIGF